MSTSSFGGGRRSREAPRHYWVLAVHSSGSKSSGSAREMGARGPRPKPTALRVLEGNKGRRPMPQHEPAPPAGMPSCPDFLNAYARGEWSRVAETLYSIGTLSQIDQMMLAAYCPAYSRWRQAEEDLERMAQ